jgi:16S rRNA (uracil1498-N3)-methyltransferase
MSLPFFFEPAVNTNSSNYLLSEETSKHCIQVLRMKEGAKINLTNGKGLLVTASITNVDKKHTTVAIDEHQMFNQPDRKLIVAVSLIKNASRFEWFLEKVTEIGVNEIIPLLCKRTERQHFRFDRMNGILIAAMLQSQQTWLPRLYEPMLFQHCIHQFDYPQKFIAHCLEDEKKQLKDFTISEHPIILIGPEGDFSAEEIQESLQHHFIPVSLGVTRLRTETAGVLAAALLMNL